MIKYLFIFFFLLNSLSAEKFKVGSILYLTNNDYSNVALEFKRGLLLFANENRESIKIIIEDDQATNRNTALAANKLINVNKVDAIFISEYVQAQVISGIVTDKKVPTFVIWESSPLIEKISDYFYGIGLWSPSAGSVPAQYAVKKRKAKTGALIYDVTAWSSSVASYFKEEFEKLGGSLLIEERHLKGASDFKTSISKVKILKPDVLFAPISEHPVTFFKQLKSLKYEGLVLASDQISDEFIKASNGAMDGLYFSNAKLVKESVTANLKQKYINEYKEAPNNIFFVALAYDAINFAFTAWKSKKGKSLKDSLKDTELANSVLANIKLDQNRSFRREEVMYKVRNGRIHPLKSK